MTCFNSKHPSGPQDLVDSFQQSSIPVSTSSAEKGTLPYWARLNRTVSSARPHAKHLSNEHPSTPTMEQRLQDAFVATRSRVLRLSGRSHFSEYTLPDCVGKIKSLRPTLWKGPPTGTTTPDVHLLFRTHEEACAALSFSTPSFPLFPALEGHLDIPHIHQIPWSDVVDEMSSITSMSRPQQPYPVASRQLNHIGPQVNPRLPNGLTPLRTEPFTLSTNPPNPKLSFRAGDWMCSMRHCAAHNFGRNVACIRCGAPRAISNGDSNTSSPISPSHSVSPRFLTTTQGQSTKPASLVTSLSQLSISQHPSISVSQPQSPITPLIAHMPLSAPPVPPKSYPPIPSISPAASRPPSPKYPILTPSGHALSAGGRVRNISRDPMSPCIMYWPDNEPLPELGQIRPNGSVAVQFPPIINTGNKGAAEKQPGDWHCSKCSYLNWRRRKVCQTCFPYAEGNGDSISAAVQAERINLLANVLNHTSSALSPSPSFPTSTAKVTLPRVGGIEQHFRSHSSQDYLGNPRAHHDLESQKALTADPIYQTSGRLSSHSTRSSHSSLRNIGFQEMRFPIYDNLGHSMSTQNESKLLPSFLQDIVHSPTLSPTTSSASCSSLFDAPHYNYSSNTSLNASPDSTVGRTAGNHEDRRREVYARNNGSDLSIWKLDGEETRSIRKGFNPTVGISSSNAGTIGSDGGSDSGDFDIAGKTPTNHPVFA